MTKKIVGTAEGGEPLQLFTLGTTAKAGRQDLSVGSGAGFHPPARMGPFRQKHLGPKEKSSGGWVEEA